MWKRVLRQLPPALALAALMLAACGAPGATPSTSGIYGQVLIGPMCPVGRTDRPCPDQPFQATIAVLDQNGRPVTHFQTDEQGNFRVGLEPGTYVLQPEPPAPGGPTRAPEQTVTVTNGQFTQVTIQYDSGIR